MTHPISLARIHDALTAPADGAVRVLADRLWPRGIRKQDLGDIIWYRDASPSPALRRAYHAGELSIAQFQTQYGEQLAQQPDVLAPLVEHAQRGPLQLLTATRDAQTSYLTVLRDAIRQQR